MCVGIDILWEHIWENVEQRQNFLDVYVGMCWKMLDFVMNTICSSIYMISLGKHKLYSPSGNITRVYHGLPLDLWYS